MWAFLYHRNAAPATVQASHYTCEAFDFHFHFVAQQLTNLSPLVQPEAECENAAAG